MNTDIKTHAWPEHPTERVDAEQIVEAFDKMLRSAFTITEREDATLTYDGIEGPQIDAATSPTLMTDKFDEGSIEYHEERGRPLNIQILMALFMCGMEAGKRMAGRELADNLGGILSYVEHTEGIEHEGATPEELAVFKTSMKLRSGLQNYVKANGVGWSKGLHEFLDDMPTPSLSNLSQSALDRIQKIMEEGYTPPPNPYEDEPGSTQAE